MAAKFTINHLKYMIPKVWGAHELKSSSVGQKMIRNLLNVPTWAIEGKKKKEKKGWDRREKEFSVQQDFLPRVCA